MHFQKNRLFIRYGFVFLFLFCFIFGLEADAGTITIKMRMSLSIVNGQIKVRMEVTNRGTETAGKLRALLRIFDRSLTSEILDRLEVQETGSFHFKIPVPPGKRGRFSFVGEVFFHDARQSRFSSLACTTFNLKEKPRLKLTGHAPNLTIWDKGNLRVGFTSLSSMPLKGKATLYLPQNLTTPSNKKTIRFEPFEAKKVNFPLKNRYGAGSGSYPVFCILEWELRGIHYTEVVKTSIRLKKYKNWFRKTKWYWLGGMIPILLYWMVLLFKRWFQYAYKWRNNLKKENKG